MKRHTMRPAHWLRTCFCVAVFACIVACGAVAVLANRFERLSKTIPFTPSAAASIVADFDDIRNRIDDARSKLNALIGHAEERRVAALRTIRMFGGEKFVLIIGDSITEASQLPARICGLPVVNAGIGGSRVADFIPFVEDIASFATPTATVVALGINDAQSIYWNNSKEQNFRMAYDQLVSMLPRGAMVATLTPIDTTQEAGKRFSQTARSAINLAIRDAAEKHKAALIELSMPPVAFGTIDGVHLTSQSYELWNEKIASAIKRDLGC